MKQVFDTDEIAHLWAHQTQQSARNPQRNFYFEGKTIFSYRDSYPLATLIESTKGVPGVLITDNGFSNTTARHLANVRRAITPEQYRNVFTVNCPRPNRGGKGKEQYRLCLESYQKRIEHALEACVTPRIREATKLKHYDRAVELRNEANAFCVFVGFKPAFKLPESIEAVSAELETKRSKLKTKQKRENAKREKEYARRAIEIREQAKPHIAAWQAGLDRIDIDGEQKYVRIPRECGTFLRLEASEDTEHPGLELVTSQGARMPAVHAWKALRLIRVIVQRGEDWARNGHQIRLGHYQIDRVAKCAGEWQVFAGCHTVPISEVERIAPELERIAAGMPMEGDTVPCD